MSVNAEDYLGLAYDIAINWNTPEYIFPKEDRIAEALFALVNASKGFDESKGFQFSSYATRIIKNRLGRYCFEHCGIGIKRSVKSKATMPKVEHIIDRDFPKQISSYSEPDDNKEIINGILSRCTPQQRYILEQVLQDKSRTEIAKSLGCTTQNVGTLYNKIIRREKSLEKFKSLAQKHRRVS